MVSPMVLIGFNEAPSAKKNGKDHLETLHTIISVTFWHQISVEESYRFRIARVFGASKLKFL